MEKKKRKGISPFNPQHWVLKGMSEMEAIFKCRSLRPIFKEYYIAKGYNETDAISLATEKKKSNNKAGARGSASRTADEFRKSSVRCPEHWMAKGLSYDEALKKIFEVQRVGSLEAFIKRYGEKDGPIKWKARQDKWQRTMCDRPLEAIALSDSKKAFSLESYITRGLTRDDFLKDVNDRYGDVPTTKTEFFKWFANNINKNPAVQYGSPKKVMSRLPGYIIELCDLTVEDFRSIAVNKKYLSRHGYIQQYVEEGFLRSSYEIDAYNVLKKNGIQFELEKPYPNSSMRCDFYIPESGTYIEICPNYTRPGHEAYTTKMDAKKKLFGCELVRFVSDLKTLLKIS